MKIKKSALERIIREEINRYLREGGSYFGGDPKLIQQIGQIDVVLDLISKDASLTLPRDLLKNMRKKLSDKAARTPPPPEPEGKAPTRQKEPARAQRQRPAPRTEPLTGPVPAYSDEIAKHKRGRGYGVGLEELKKP